MSRHHGMDTNELVEKWLRDDPRVNWQKRSLSVSCGLPSRDDKSQTLIWYATLTVGSESFEAGGDTEDDAIKMAIWGLASHLDGPNVEV